MRAHWPRTVEGIHATANQVLSLNATHALVLWSTKEKCEKVFNTREGKPGVRFDRAYDLEALTPVPAWQQLYDEVKAEVCEMGLESLFYSPQRRKQAVLERLLPVSLAGTGFSRPVRSTKTWRKVFYM